MEKEFVKDQDILNEGKLLKDKTIAFEAAERLFWHCLKWKHQKSHQEADWVSTVKESIKILNNKTQNTNIKNYVSTNLNIAFDRGLDDVYNETGVYIKSDEEARSEICYLSAVLSAQYIKSWMSKYKNPNKPDFLSKWIV